MLELQEITFSIPKDGEELDLIHNVSLTVGGGHFMAIVGPSGCGKTTILKVIAGLIEESSGRILWEGRNLAEEGDLEPSEIGYVPQFSIAFDYLTVEESVESAVRLRVRTKSRAEVHEIADRVVEQVGLDDIRDHLVKVISGGQKRRLGLAMEMVSNPLLLLCDEVTSGLDPKSEREIVHLMHGLSQENDRIVINVTHSLSNLELYDSVLVMYEGKAVYHGPPRALAHYFSVENAEDVYPRLSKYDSWKWHRSWSKHREPYYKAFGMRAGSAAEAAAASASAPETEPDPQPAPPSDAPEAADPAVAGEAADFEEVAAPRSAEPGAAADDELPVHSPPRPAGAAETPGLLAQFFVLLGRRARLFFRDRTHLALHLAILFGFPFLVVIFALDGIDQMPRRLPFDEVQSAADYAKQTEIIQKQVELGGLVSGLVMFQVILLTLMGSNNSAREIAAERLIFEKEKFAGLRSSSYLLSKAAFLSVLILAQSVWMAVFVRTFTGLPGEFGDQIGLLILVNAAMTFVCLGISALMRSPEQASLLSIYLVGFQLPLSGAVLALPNMIEAVTRPFIAAYWSWSGQLQAMKASDYFVGIKEATATSLDAAPALCGFVLLAHVAAGAIAAYVGCSRNHWQ